LLTFGEESTYLYRSDFVYFVALLDVINLIINYLFVSLLFERQLLATFTIIYYILYFGFDVIRIVLQEAIL